MRIYTYELCIYKFKNIYLHVYPYIVDKTQCSIKTFMTIEIHYHWFHAHILVQSSGCTTSAVQW